jgi:hypothetical protein
MRRGAKALAKGLLGLSAVHGLGSGKAGKHRIPRAIRIQADAGATGENPVVVACRTADVIAGPIGILCADALMGEITPTMAVAVGQSNADRLLFPVNHCRNTVVGTQSLSLSKLMDEAVELLRGLLG